MVLGKSLQRDHSHGFSGNEWKWFKRSINGEDFPVDFPPRSAGKAINVIKILKNKWKYYPSNNKVGFLRCLPLTGHLPNNRQLQYFSLLYMITSDMVILCYYVYLQFHDNEDIVSWRQIILRNKNAICNSSRFCRGQETLLPPFITGNYTVDNFIFRSHSASGSHSSGGQPQRRWPGSANKIQRCHQHCWPSRRQMNPWPANKWRISVQI